MRNFVSTKINIWGGNTESFKKKQQQNTEFRWMFSLILFRKWSLVILLAQPGYE